MADAAQVALKKKRTFKKFSYRGVELDKLLDLSIEEFVNMTNSRHRRAHRRGLKKKHQTLIAKMRAAKKNATGLDKPAPVKTHVECLKKSQVSKFFLIFFFSFKLSLL